MFLFVLIFLLLLLVFATVGSFRAAKNTYRWFLNQSKELVIPDTTKLTDFVTVIGFGLTIAGIVMSLYTVTLQTDKGNVELRAKTLSDGNAALRDRLQTVLAHPADEFSHDIDVHLESPVSGISLLQGVMPNLRWNFVRHNARLDYVVEVVWLDGAPKQSYKPVPISATCDFFSYPVCRFHASDPNNQLSLIPGNGRLQMHVTPKVQGRFLWRVIPISGVTQSSDNIELAKISDWSEYANFSAYSDGSESNGEPSANYRMSSTRRVIVGTTFSDNVKFSTVYEGRASGHDIDLITLIVEGCLSMHKPENLAYDPVRCSKYTAFYEGKGRLPGKDEGPAKERNLEVRISPFPNVDAGLGALARHEIDLFIGSITRTTARENELVAFTDGYYRFTTQLYVPSFAQQGTLPYTFDRWIQRQKRVGVIENSTNHWLATHLAAEPPLAGRLSVVAFPSYASLENAFEKRDVDGVIIDSVLGRQLPGYTEISLEETAAWGKFKEWIGFDTEEFAIAVATTKADDIRRVRSGSFATRFLNLPEVSKPTLYSAIQDALRSPFVQDALVKLRDVHGLPADDLRPQSIGGREEACLVAMAQGVSDQECQ